jgi:hypothetical protein
MIAYLAKIFMYASVSLAALIFTANMLGII